MASPLISVAAPLWFWKFLGIFSIKICGIITSNNFPSRGQITTPGGVHLRGTTQYFQVGTVSILVNNAGIVSGTALLDTPDARSLFSEIF